MNPKLTLRAAGSGGVFTRRDALECGYTERQIRSRLADGRWERLRQGVYAESVELGDLPPWDRELARHRRLVQAAMLALRSEAAVVSHQSALVMHGIPVWAESDDTVHVTRLDKRRSGLAAGGIVQHAGTLTEAEVVRIAGLRVSSVPRALVEFACCASFESVVVSADAALHAGLVDGPDLARMLVQTRTWPGAAMARAAIPFASRRSESVGESRLRVLMDRCDLPRPELQAVIRDEVGAFVARVDFYFPAQRTVVEFDGLTKYGDAADLAKEKQREDRLRALGLQVVRVIWSELDGPTSVAAAIRAAFSRAATGSRGRR